MLSKNNGLFGFLILVSFSSLNALAEVANLRTPVDPAILIFSHEPSDNEFPRTVGTVKRENNGFEVNWENGSVFEFWDDWNFFGLFDDTETAPSSTKTKQITSNSKLNQQAKTQSICQPGKADPKLERAKVNKQKKAGEPEKELGALIFGKSKKQDEKAIKAKVAKKLDTELLKQLAHKEGLAEVEDITTVEIIDKSSDKVATTDQSSDKSSSNEKDWRAERKWWQRGTPVL